MLQIKEIVTNKLIIEKSVFITTLYPVKSINEINEIYKSVCKKYYDATHNCYAYILDNGQIQKSSDDGEPAKTAGYPMLDVLNKQKMTNILVITTRYFGGIKLGAGGLVRAYSNSVSEALKIATKLKEEIEEMYEIALNYSEYNNVINSFDFLNIINTVFTDNVLITVTIKKENNKIALEKIKNLTNGKASIKYLHEERTLVLA